MKTAEERELKFDLDPGAALPELSGVVDGVTSLRRSTIHLHAIYFDTPDLRLLHRGVTLRHRTDRSGHGEDGWTLKLPGARPEVGMRRTELSWPGGAQAIPAEAVDIVTALTAGTPLAAVADMGTLRHRIELHDRLGGRLAEIDDDEVTVVTTMTTTAFREVEVELDTGDEGLLGSIGARLYAAGARRGDDEPKVRRALVPRPSAASPIASGDTMSTVVTDGIGKSLTQLVTHDMAIRVSADVESVHQARVATRRLRSDLLTLAELLDPEWVARTRLDLRWVGMSLGAVRDADVLAARLARHAATAAAADAVAFRRLQDRLTEERLAALGRLLGVLRSTRYLNLLQALDRSARVPPVALSSGDGGDSAAAQLSATALAPLVGVPWRSLRKAVDRLDDRPSAKQLHRIRIKAKRVRYAAELAGPVVGRPAKRLARSAASLQTTLGELNDAVSAERWFRAAATDTTLPAAFAAGQCVTFERLEQMLRRSEWRKEWAKMRRAGRRRWMR